MMNAAVERFEYTNEPGEIHPNFGSVIQSGVESRPQWEEYDLTVDERTLLAKVETEYSALAEEKDLSPEEQKLALKKILDGLSLENPNIKVALAQLVKRLVVEEA